jgi:hypothetical protein
VFDIQHHSEYSREHHLQHTREGGGAWLKTRSGKTVHDVQQHGKA